MRALTFVVPLALVLGAAAPAVAQYSVSSAPGSLAIPASGTGGGGTWPGGLPPSPLVMALATPVPANATNIKRIKLMGLDHTWAGDIHFVLNAPNGTRYDLLHRVGSAGTDLGFSVNFGSAFGLGADYTLVSPGDPSINQTWPTTNPGSGSFLPAGIYAQEHGTAWGGGWPSGTNAIQNVALSAIPAAPGIWSLSIYDWAVIDTGFLTQWTMEGDTGPSQPTAYCTSGTSTSGCSPSISATAQPSTTFATQCTLNVTNVEGQRTGLLFYGIDNAGFTPLQWATGSTSFLCVKPPTQRTPPQNSGGTAGGCNGALTLDWNAWQSANPTSLGNPFSVGDKVYAQAWYRDPPAPKTTNLSNAIQLTYE
jgi:hypothetical protein